jgi:hypothetical protein
LDIADLRAGPGAQLHQTREAWLNYVAQCMASMFEELAAPLPAQLRIAIGFTSSGRRSRNIGECWDNQCSEDRHFEIFIRPDLSESKDLLPMQVAAILGHELVQLLLGSSSTASPPGSPRRLCFAAPD